MSVEKEIEVPEDDIKEEVTEPKEHFLNCSKWKGKKKSIIPLFETYEEGNFYIKNNVDCYKDFKPEVKDILYLVCSSSSGIAYGAKFEVSNINKNVLWQADNLVIFFGREIEVTSIFLPTKIAGDYHCPVYCDDTGSPSIEYFKLKIKDELYKNFDANRC